MAQASRRYVHTLTGKQRGRRAKMPQVTQPDVQWQFAIAATMPFEVEQVRPEEISDGAA